MVEKEVIDGVIVSCAAITEKEDCVVGVGKEDWIVTVGYFVGEGEFVGNGGIVGDGVVASEIGTEGRSTTVGEGRDVTCLSWVGLGV